MYDAYLGICYWNNSYIQCIFLCDQLEVDCRVEICKRMLKFTRQQAHKKKKVEEDRFVMTFLIFNR